jgi:hypothetical protein
MDGVEKIVRAPSIEGVEIVRKGPNGERIVLWEDPLYPAIRKFMDEIFPDADLNCPAYNGEIYRSIERNPNFW